MVALSEWLQLMLAEIARKRDDLDLARAEDARRGAEAQSNSPQARREGAARSERLQ